MFTGQLPQDSRNAGGSPEERRRERDIGRWLTGSLANIRQDISSLRRWTQRTLALEFGESQHGDRSPLLTSHWASYWASSFSDSVITKSIALSVIVTVIFSRGAVIIPKSPSRPALLTFLHRRKGWAGS